MLGLNYKLKNLEDEGRSIKIALVGMGQMGSSFIAHVRNIHGMEIIAAASKEINSAAEVMTEVLGINRQELMIVKGSSKLNEGYGDCQSFVFDGTLDGKLKLKLSGAVKNKKIILTDDFRVINFIEEADFVVDATGNPEAGARIAYGAISNKRNLVTFNVETDTTIGPFIKKMADEAGVIYTLAAGDEPGALKELYDLANALNLEVIAAGKGKNNPLDREANPTTLAGYSKEKGANPRMMTSFVDGSKSMFEMACMSNSTGLVPDIRGMHGPRANVDELTKIFALKKEGGILNKKGVVDFAVGDVAPGVFLVYTTPLKILKEELKYLLFGDGPNYLLYRPYHLTSIEAPISIARAYFYNEPTIAPMGNLISEVITVAKKDLKTGQELDGIGGYTVYGLLELYDKAREENLLPLGLSESARLKRNIPKDQPITYDDIEFSKEPLILQLRRLQEKQYFKNNIC